MNLRWLYSTPPPWNGATKMNTRWPERGGRNSTCTQIPAGLVGEPPYGLLGTEVAKNEKPDSFMSPKSWDLLAENKPVIAYSTAPLEKDLRVWGPLSATLYGSSTSQDPPGFMKIK